MNVPAHLKATLLVVSSTAISEKFYDFCRSYSPNSAYMTHNYAEHLHNFQEARGHVPVLKNTRQNENLANRLKAVEDLMAKEVPLEIKWNT